MGDLAGVWQRYTHIDVVRGAGSWVEARDGVRYLDLTGGIAATSTGHCHPAVVAAIREQAGRFIHAQVNCYQHPLLTQLADALDEVTPPEIGSFFFSNSGAEAIEATVKLARHATRRANLIVFDGAFHGRTAQTMAMTSSRVATRVGFQPLPAGVFVAPFPADASAAEATRSLAAIERMLVTQTAPEETAAIVVEPVLGEGGYVVPHPTFLQGLRELADRYGILLVADEVQSGFGRTGRFFAFEHAGVVPDMIAMAKGLGSGFPISAIGASRELMEAWSLGSHGGTYGGNPLGCAAAIATIDVIRSERLMDNAARRGEQLLAGLHELARDFPAIQAVRGLGLMAAIDLYDPAELELAQRRVDAVLTHCREQSRVLLLPVGSWSAAIRLAPPLNVSAAEIDQGLGALRDALADVAAPLAVTAATAQSPAADPV
jgi:4-aminobutyrate aminotransferase